MMKVREIKKGIVRYDIDDFIGDAELGDGKGRKEIGGNYLNFIIYFV